jgi:uroporphyrinogen decarboxylase
MDEKTRIEECIRFKRTDKIPWQINFTYATAEKLLNYLGIKTREYNVLGKNIFKYKNLNDYLGNHIAYIRNIAVNSETEIEPGIWKDEWGVIWNRKIDTYIGNVSNCVLEEGDLKKLKIPDCDDPNRYLHFEPIINENSNLFISVRFSMNIFERAWMLRGMENLMMDFIQNPGFVHELFSVITEFNLRVLKNLTNYKIDGIRFGDDWGSQRGLLMSPAMWREFIKPYAKIIFEQAAKQGYDVIIHCCGKIDLIMEDLIEIGVKVYNPFQPEVLNKYEMFSKYSNRIAFYGGLSTQKTMSFGSKEEVIKEVEDALALGVRYSGFIISPSHDVPSDISAENILAVADVLKGQ